MVQMISIIQNIENDSLEINRNRLRADRRAFERRMKVERQRRLIGFGAFAIVLGFILTFTVLGTSAKATGTDEAAKGYKFYKEVYVESGDSLWSIASQYTDGSLSETSDCVKEIREINSLEIYETLKAGSYIVVPYYSND